MRIARRLGEIAIVTIGILLAFALDAWWDGRNLAEREQVHLRALASDLERNVTALTGQVEHEERVISSCEQLLKLSQGSGREGAPLTDLVNQVFNSNRYEPVMGAYEALVDWPHAKRSGPLYREAVETVSAALSGTRTREAARKAFVAAADEIGILVS